MEGDASFPVRADGLESTGDDALCRFLREQEVDAEIIRPGRDTSSVPFFDRGNELGSAKHQSTLLVGFVVYFGPKR